MSPRLPGALLAFFCVAVLAGACSSETTEPPADDGSTAQPGGVLAFSAPRLGGGTIEGVDFAGRDVAFWFWAPW